MTPEEIADLFRRLAEPFDPRAVKFRPGATAGNRALAIPYVDARTIEDCLDRVVGPQNWQDEYTFLPDGSCLCRLSLRVNGEWLTKTDVGGQSEQSDEGDRRKAAVSDALKRAAVKWGVGRYLYRLPQTWVDYDPQKKQLKTLPKLPGPEPAPAKAVPSPQSKAVPPMRPVSTYADRIRRLDGWLVKLGVADPGVVIGSVEAKAGAKLDALSTPPAREDAVACAETMARNLLVAACSDRLEAIGIDYATALERQNIAAGTHWNQLGWDRLGKLLTWLRAQPVPVTV